MYCLIDFCCICFNNKEHLQHLSTSDLNNITYFIKLTSCVPEMCSNEMTDQRLVCKTCCETMDAAYKFRQECLRSKTTLADYISQLRQVSNISGAVNIYLTDINKLNDIEKKYSIENNLEIKMVKTELSKNVDKETNEKQNSETDFETKINSEHNPISFKLIDNRPNYIQAGNIVVKMEHEDTNSEEHTATSFDRSLENQNDIKIDVSKNDFNLTMTEIKKENDYQNDHLQERINNILETCDHENKDMGTEIEKNHKYLCNSEIYSDESMLNLDEIKIEIADNDIELMNGEINIQCKKDVLDESSKDVFCLETKNRKSTSSSNISRLQRCAVSSRKVKIKRNVTGKKIHGSKISKKILNKPSDVNRDMIMHNLVKPNACTVCFEKFSRSDELTIHMRTHTSENIHECSVCQKKFSVASTLRTHFRIHTGEKPYECSVCKKKFNNTSDLKMHLRIHTGERPYECSVCKKTFMRSTNLIMHLRVHTGAKPYECSICKKAFSQSSNLKKHLRIHTAGISHECSICKKTFSQSAHLKKHLRIHTGAKPHECSVCKKTFSQSANLKMHLRIHTGAKPHECSVCKKTFCRSSNLKEHLGIHTGAKPHECNVCKKTFRQSANLKIHLRIHTGAKPHECSVCKKTFSRSDNLKTHFRMHTREKPQDGMFVRDHVVGNAI